MSVFDEILTAAVIRYPYLWSREEGKGETGGRKVRPVAVGVRIARADGDLVLFFPITTKQPERDRFAFEIPVIEKRRAGLDADADPAGLGHPSLLAQLGDRTYSESVHGSRYLSANAA